LRSPEVGGLARILVRSRGLAEKEKENGVLVPDCLWVVGCRP
jgi:hypothetical protein